MERVLLALAAFVLIQDIAGKPFETIMTLQQNNDLWNDSDPMVQTAPSSHNLRLTKTLAPSFYRLKLKPDLDKSTFSGEVLITLKTNAHNVRNIILHSKDLNINSKVMLTEQLYENLNKVHVRNRRQVESDPSHTHSPTTDPTTANPIITTIPPVPSEPVSDKAEINTKSNNNSSIELKKEVTDKSNITELTDKSAPASVKEKNVNTSIDINEIHTKNSSTATVSIDNENTIITSNKHGLEKSPHTQVTHSNTRNIKVTSIHKDTSTDRLIINLETPLKPGTDYTLELAFDGNITDSLNGFYKSSYVDVNKQTKVLAVTQFEPVSARQAFPCFDEPIFKAKFEISIAHPDNMTALSNMAVAAKEPIPETPGWSWTHFERSVRMSTYLVAYTVCEFKFLETSYVSKDNLTKPIRVWTRPSLIDNAQYAIKIVPKLLEFYEEWFGVPYALNKLDLIAVPDFSSGAMENWGFITFRETGLLYDEKTKVARERQTVAVDVSHELAHQWFGNLVTMAWWTDLWLNEGFATYVEYVGVNHVAPEWAMLDTFTRDKMELLRSDALKHTTAVSKVVQDAAEIGQKFDEISYSKGASLIRMLNHTVTEPLFHKGLVAYLKKWIYSNAVEDDLWAAMDDAVVGNSSIVKFMKTWTSQPGYPVVTVKRSYGGSEVVFRQDFFTSVKNPYKSRLDQLWSIPISYTTIDKAVGPWDTAPKLWLNEREQKVDIPLNKSQALYVNVDSIGYYRVNYDNDNWRLLNGVLNANGNVIPPLARAQLLDDAFNLAKVSQLDYRFALDLTTYLAHGENSRIVWELALSNLAFLKFTLRSTPYYNDFQDYVLRILHKELKKHDYGLQPPRDDDEAFLIESLLSWECFAESPRCLSWARAEFGKWMNQSDPEDNPIPSHLRGLVYSTALKYGGRAEFDFLWRAFRSASEPSAASGAVGCLASTRDEGLVRLLLERSLTEIPNQYASYAWAVDSASGAAVAQQFIASEWERVYAKFGRLDSFVFSSVVSGAFGYIGTADELDRFKRFVEEHAEALKPQMQSILKLVDAAGMRIEWVAAHAAPIGAWLREYNGNATRAATNTTSSNGTTSSISMDSSTKTAAPADSVANTTSEHTNKHTDATTTENTTSAVVKESSPDNSTNKAENSKPQAVNGTAVDDHV